MKMVLVMDHEVWEIVTNAYEEVGCCGENVFGRTWVLIHTGYNGIKRDNEVMSVGFVRGVKRWGWR